MREFDLAIIAVLSVTAATLFTESITVFVDTYFVKKYRHKSLTYFISSIVIIIILVIFSIKRKI
jgi:predicted transglutaminase-like protease